MLDLSLDSLASAYASGDLTPSVLVARLCDAIDAYEAVDPAVWIHRISKQDLLDRAAELEAGAAADRGPLFGIPFAVKDNVDVAGLPSTMGCPAPLYIAEETSFAVQNLLDAGAILVGKTNLDQFATGLVGVRSPYGAPRCVFNRDYVSGGSSSGSAVAVAAGLATFSFGTDTAGSGRVPAGFNNIVGIKPTRGLLSTSGVFPANKTLDCLSIFALSTADGDRIRRVAEGFDPEDPFSRAGAPVPLPLENPRIGIPMPDQLTFFGDDAAAELFNTAVEKAETLGWEIVTFDYEPFRATAELLYGSAWVAERLAAVKPYLDKDLHPVTRQIIEDAGGFDATDAFEAIYAAQRLHTRCAMIAKDFDLILVPTSPTIYRVDAVEDDPITLNSNLGTYTNFVNLLDMAAVSVPAGFRANGLPFGVTLVGPGQSDDALAVLADRLHRGLHPRSGMQDSPLAAPALSVRDSDGLVTVCVVGAHLTGMPLNSQLTERNATLLETTRTAPDYRFYALADSVPPKPGLSRDPNFDGPGIEVELWQMPMESFGSFVALIPQPLGIGTVTLADGRNVKGFICEPAGIATATEITHYGGWRAYRADAAA
ncbi:allophanate hydrolase [Hwanghaeella grinnelliae]|uniref:Allophanate hydrolase n=2 Tax=Hwanghaeella grinnelliae TaxID=2500179 RepID=A0A3S2WDD1_9PROT|nr:allophanate hydrolase [Hwanghaeella grinnelliae]